MRRINKIHQLCRFVLFFFIFCKPRNRSNYISHLFSIQIIRKVETLRVVFKRELQLICKFKHPSELVDTSASYNAFVFSLFTILLFATWICMTCVGATAIKNGDPARLYSPINDKGTLKLENKDSLNNYFCSRRIFYFIRANLWLHKHSSK